MRLVVICAGVSLGRRRRVCRRDRDRRDILRRIVAGAVDHDLDRQRSVVHVRHRRRGRADACPARAVRHEVFDRVVRRGVGQLRAVRVAVVGPAAALEVDREAAVADDQVAREHRERVVSGLEAAAVDEAQRPAHDRVLVRIRHERIIRQRGIVSQCAAERGRFALDRAVDNGIGQRGVRRTIRGVRDRLVVCLHRQRARGDREQPLYRRERVVARGGCAVQRARHDRVRRGTDVRHRTRCRRQHVVSLAVEEPVARDRHVRVGQRFCIICARLACRRQRDRPRRDRHVRVAERGRVVVVHRHEVDGSALAHVRRRRARRKRVVRGIRAVVFAVADHRAFRQVRACGYAVGAAVVLVRHVARTDRQRVGRGDRQLAFRDGERIVRGARARGQRVGERVVRRADVRDRAVRGRGGETLPLDEAVVARGVVAPGRARQRAAVVHLRRGGRRQSDNPLINGDGFFAEHRVVVRVRHHEVDRGSRRVVRQLRVLRQAVVRGIVAVRQAVADLRALDRRRDRDPVRLVVISAGVAFGRRRRVCRGDREKSVYGRNVVLIRHVRRAAHDLHRAEHNARGVCADVCAAAGDGIARDRYTGHIDSSGRHGTRRSIIGIGCAVRRDDKRLVLCIHRIDRGVCSQVVCRGWVIGAHPIVVCAADRDVPRRGHLIGCVARAVCHPFGTDHHAVCAGAVCHLRVDRQRSVDPGHRVPLGHVHAAALEHESRLVAKARRVNARIGAGRARGRILDGEAANARRNAGNALCTAVIILRGAVGRQRQRGLCRPNRIQRQVCARHHHVAARRIACVRRGSGRNRAPAEEVVTRTRKRIRVYRKAGADRLCRAIVRASARRTAVAVIGQGKERLLRMNHDCVIRRHAIECVAVPCVRGCREGCAVVRHARDFISRRIRPADGSVRAVDIHARAALGTDAFGGIRRNGDIECLIFPDRIQRAGRGWNAHPQQNAVAFVIDTAAAVWRRIPADEHFSGVKERVPLHRMICVVQRAARKGGRAAACCAAVTVVGDRHLIGGIDPDRGQGRILRHRDRAVGIIDLIVHAGAPADEYLVRGRRDRSRGIRLHLRLAAGSIGQAVHGRGSARFAELIGYREIQRADPNGVQDHVLIDLHTGIKQDQRTVFHDQPTAERVRRVGFVRVCRILRVLEGACADGSAICDLAKVHRRAAGCAERDRMCDARKYRRFPDAVDDQVVRGHRPAPAHFASGKALLRGIPARPDIVRGNADGLLRRARRAAKRSLIQQARRADLRVEIPYRQVIAVARMPDVQRRQVAGADVGYAGCNPLPVPVRVGVVIRRSEPLEAIVDVKRGGVKGIRRHARGARPREVQVLLEVVDIQLVRSAIGKLSVQVQRTVDEELRSAVFENLQIRQPRAARCCIRAPACEFIAVVVVSVDVRDRRP